MGSQNKKYTVYRVVNLTSGAKKNKKYYIISTITDPEKLKTIIRGMKNSSTAKGGIKTIANDMKAQGDDYREEFSITPLVKGTSKERATEIRNSLKSKTPPAKIYNEPRS
jgi:hypothetical protein